MNYRFATLKSFSIISFGNITSRIISALISIILARKFGPAVFGNYSILFAVMTTIGLGFSGLDITYVHNAIKFKKIEFSSYFSTKILLFLIVVIPVLLFSKVIINSYFKNISLLGFIIALIASFFFAIYTTIYAYFQRHEMYKKYAIFQIFFYFISLIIILGLIFFYKNIPYYSYLISYIIAGISAFIIFLIIIKDIKLKFSPDIINFFKFGKWIILSELSLVLFARLDLIILSHFIIGVNLGYYSAAIRIINIFLTFTAAFSVIMLPKASKIKNRTEQNKFYKSGFIIVGVLVLLAIIIMLLSKYIVILFYGKEYIPAFKYIILLLLAYLPFAIYQPFRYITYTFNNTKLLFIVSLIQNIILIACGWYSIKIFGINGIIYIKGFAYLVALIIFIYVSYKTGKKYKYENNS